MNTIYKKFSLIIVGFSLLMASGCEKFLDEKSNKALAVPVSLPDLQALLDDFGNVGLGGDEAELSSDDYYITKEALAALNSESERLMYSWNPVISQVDRSSTGWYAGYLGIYYANTVLEQLNEVPRNAYNATEWDHLKGQAHFFRAMRYLDMALVWAPAYDAATADKDLGLPLRLSPDFNQPSRRSGVQETYGQIAGDLQAAVPLLPVQPLSVYRASRPAAYALLSRTFLAMREYDQAYLYADSALQLKADLLDYNTLNAAANFPLVRATNKEILLLKGFGGIEPLDLATARIVPELYNSYGANDLRKSLFFRLNSDGSARYKGSYYGNSSYFTGVAIDEVYLTRAECLARKGKVQEAMADLNSLLLKRWKSGTFVPLTASDKQSALALVLIERRKELLMRGIRWMDVKRLNKEGAGITMRRSLTNTEYTIAPNDPRYALPIPEDVIRISGMQQNPR